MGRGYAIGQGERARKVLPHAREGDPLAVTERIHSEGRWFSQIELERNDIVKLARRQGMSKTDAQAWVYSESDRMYPPLPDRTLSYSGDQPDDSENRTLSGAQRPAAEAVAVLLEEQRADG